MKVSNEMTVSNVDPKDVGHDPHPRADEVDIIVQVEAIVDEGEIIDWTIEGAWVDNECGSPTELEVANFTPKIIERIEQQAEDAFYDS